MTRRSTSFAAVLGLSLLGGCGADQSSEGFARDEPAAAETPAAPADEGEPISDEMRSALTGLPLSDDEIHFLDAALERSGTEYTEHGLATFAEWELVAEVSEASDGRWRLAIAGPRVNAEWELFVDRATGAVEEGMVATLEEPPPDE